jgi:hypothetical protein
MTLPPKAARLPLDFAPAGLQADLATLGSGEWLAHFNTGYFTGDWSGVALRAIEGSANPMYADPSRSDFADTALLQHCEHIRAVVESFQCPLRSVRLLRLTPGSVIREHRDYDLGYDAGEIRIHIPVITNPGVEFYLDNRRILMGEGECWYLDLNLPHRVQNLGNTDRVHLVIDCQLNDWLRELISRGTVCEGTESGYPPFHKEVLGDTALQEELASITDTKALIARTVELGRDRGFHFQTGDVEAALQAARRAWTERWIL